MKQAKMTQANGKTSEGTKATAVTRAPAKVRIEGLYKIFDVGHGKVTALDNVNITIPDGEFLCIVGPSGCGKTTLLRILAGLETASEGNIIMTQRDKSKPMNSMIFQEQSVFPWMTVQDNIAYGLRMRGVDRKESAEKVDFYVRKIGLLKFAKAYPHQLSGGMKQRVSVARAFANDPEVLLMDEPFAALDEQNKVLLQEELLRIWEETRKTVIFITHSIDEAIVLGDRVIVMTAHPGRVKADVRVDFPRPRKVYELRAQPKYGELAYKIWDLLRDEVLKAKREEGTE
ncbi:MAG: ABC transporter ATP-binding protein [Dehalococcoidales bacterium]|nr:ABC transporter ATP-binding protein [Dehalococcoidales bacterium]